MKIRLFYFMFPMLLLLLGVIIHLSGLFHLFRGNITLWNLWVHFSMLFIDISAILGLVLRKKWGHYEALAIFVLFAIVQLALAVLHIISDGPFGIQNTGTFFLCILAVYCIYKNGLEKGLNL